MSFRRLGRSENTRLPDSAQILVDSDSPGSSVRIGADRIDRSRLSTTNSSSGFWGLETLPPNASGVYQSLGSSGFAGPVSANSSAFHFSDSSQFFPPLAASAGGFSFEGESPTETLLKLRSSPVTLEPESIDRWPNSPVNVLHNIQTPRSRSSCTTFKFTIQGIHAVDKSILTMTRPQVEDLKPGADRVAVVGKTFFRLLSISTGSQKFPGPSSVFSIAQRRSRSRGSPVPINSTSHSPTFGAVHDNSETTTQEKEGQVTELLDIKSGTRLPAGAVFTDTQWGYGVNNDKIATAFSNGTIALWNPEASTTSRLEMTAQQHDRTVNRVIFGPRGRYLLSAGQDGQIKIWDFQSSRPYQQKIKSSAPLTNIKFSPSPSQPWTLLSVSTSGTLIRYDLRKIGESKPGSAVLDRISAHDGYCGAVDWRPGTAGDSLSLSDTNMNEFNDGGWVVTGGMDGQLKIWDFSQPVLSTRPVKILHSTQPINRVQWNPTRGNEIACSPMSSIGISIEHSSDNSNDKSNWKNEIEIWDTRRVHVPKCAIKTDTLVSSFFYSSDSSLYTSSRTAPNFEQYDIRNDSYSIVDNIAKPPAVWSINSDFYFAGGDRSAGSEKEDTNTEWSNFLKSNESVPVDAPAERCESSINIANACDPTFCFDTFEYVARSLKLHGNTLEEICAFNAEIYSNKERCDAAQVWLTLATWYQRDETDAGLPAPLELEEQDPIASQNSPPRASFGSNHTDSSISPETNSLDSDRLKQERQSTTMQRPRRSFLSTASRLSLNTDSDRPSFSHVRRTTADTDSSRDGDVGDVERSSRKLVRQPPSRAKSLSRSLSRRKYSNTSPSLSRMKGLALSGLAPLSTDMPSAADDPTQDIVTDDDLNLAVKKPKAYEDTGSRAISSGSESDSEDTTLIKRARSRQQRGRRLSSNPQLDSANFNKAAAKLSELFQEKVETPEIIEEPKVKDKDSILLYATELVRRQVIYTLQEYADQGDTQLCAAVCIVMRNFEIDVPESFALRVTKAYMIQLRDAELHVSAAALLKYSSMDQLSRLGQTNVVFYTACGVCGKSLEQSPFGTCLKCRKVRTICVFCRLPITGIVILCPTCGHVIHKECTFSLAHHQSHLKDLLTPSEKPISHPSTPGLGVSAPWLFKTDATIRSESSFYEESDMSHCPSGVCFHASNCLIPL